MKLSIVTTIYKRPEEIDAFFERFSTQENKNFELIVAVDTNKLGQLEKVQKWAKKFKNKMKIIYNTKRQGRTKSHMDAIKLATGEYTLFICTADEIKRTTGIGEIIDSLKKTNMPDVLEFPASFRGVKRWNADLRIKSTTATCIEKKPMFIAKTMPYASNKIYRTELMIKSMKGCSSIELNSKFSVEWLYVFLVSNAKTFATVNKRLVKTFIDKNSVSFNPIRISNQLAKLIAASDGSDNVYLQELTYAFLYTIQILMPIFAISFKNKVMFDKLYDLITKVFDKEFKNVLPTNKYLLKNNKEAIWLSAKRTKTELRKLVKEFE